MDMDDIFKCVMLWALTPVAWWWLKESWNNGGIDLLMIPLSLFILIMSCFATASVVFKILEFFCK